MSPHPQKTGIQLVGEHHDGTTTVIPLYSFQPTESTWNAYYFYKNEETAKIEVRQETTDYNPDPTKKEALAKLHMRHEDFAEVEALQPRRVRLACDLIPAGVQSWDLRGGYPICEIYAGDEEFPTEDILEVVSFTIDEAIFRVERIPKEEEKGVADTKKEEKDGQQQRIEVDNERAESVQVQRKGPTGDDAVLVSGSMASGVSRQVEANGAAATAARGRSQPSLTPMESSRMPERVLDTPALEARYRDADQGVEPSENQAEDVGIASRATEEPLSGQTVYFSAIHPSQDQVDTPITEERESLQSTTADVDDPAVDESVVIGNEADEDASDDTTVTPTKKRKIVTYSGVRKKKKTTPPKAKVAGDIGATTTPVQPKPTRSTRHSTKTAPSDDCTDTMDDNTQWTFNESTQSSVPAVTTRTSTKPTKSPLQQSQPPDSPQPSHGCRIVLSNTEIPLDPRYASFLEKNDLVIDSQLISPSSDTPHPPKILIVPPPPLKRTSKFTLAVALGQTIVTHDWLIDSVAAGHLLPTKPYQPHDPEREREWGFDLDGALVRGRSGVKAFSGYTLFFAPSLMKDLKERWTELRDIALGAGAAAVRENEIPSAVKKEREMTGVIGSGKGDRRARDELRECGANGHRVYSKDVVSLSVLRGAFEEGSADFLIHSVSSHLGLEG